MKALTLTCSLVALFFISPAFAGPPALSTSGDTLTVSHDQCKVQAAAALAKSGYSEISTSGQSVFGNKGDFAAMVRCFVKPDFVVFVVSAPNGTDTDGERAKVAGNF